MSYPAFDVCTKVNSIVLSMFILPVINIYIVKKKTTTTKFSPQPNNLYPHSTLLCNRS